MRLDLSWNMCLGDAAVAPLEGDMIRQGAVLSHVAAAAAEEAAQLEAPLLQAQVGSVCGRGGGGLDEKAAGRGDPIVPD